MSAKSTRANSSRTLDQLNQKLKAKIARAAKGKLEKPTVGKKTAQKAQIAQNLLREQTLQAEARTDTLATKTQDKASADVQLSSLAKQAKYRRTRTLVGEATFSELPDYSQSPTLAAATKAARIDANLPVVKHEQISAPKSNSPQDLVAQELDQHLAALEEATLYAQEAVAQVSETGFNYQQAAADLDNTLDDLLALSFGDLVEPKKEPNKEPNKEQNKEPNKEPKPNPVKPDTKKTQPAAKSEAKQPAQTKPTQQATKPTQQQQPKSAPNSQAKSPAPAQENSEVDYRSKFAPQAGVEFGQEYRTGVVFLEIDPADAGRRIDNFLISVLPDVPKSTWYKLMREGQIRVNKKRIKSEYKLLANDLIRLAPLTLVHKQDKQVSLAERIQLDSIQRIAKAIIVEDNVEKYLIVNKPSGVAVHGGSGVDYGVIEALRVLHPLKKRLELVHRIDRDTSGLLLVAMTPSALTNLQDQFRDKTVQKSYLCLVPGKFTSQTVEAPLERITKQDERFVIVSPNGKPAKTHFKLVQAYQDAQGKPWSLLKASPVTGRTHQIRVHALHACNALGGDAKYASAEDLAAAKAIGLKRLFLHAAEIEFNNPKSGKRVKFSAPLPTELEVVLRNLEALER